MMRRWSSREPWRTPMRSVHPAPIVPGILALVFCAVASAHLGRSGTHGTAREQGDVHEATAWGSDEAAPGAARDPATSAKNGQAADVDDAIDRALGWLAIHQSP